MTDSRSEYKTYELTPELLAGLAVAQNVPVEMLRQFDNERLGFTREDFLAHGGYLSIDGWKVEPIHGKITLEQTEAGHERPHIGWKVQWTLSAWVDLETGEARRLNQPLDKQRLVRFSMRLRKQSYFLEDLSNTSATALLHIYRAQLGGANVAINAALGEEFALQFDLQAVHLRYREGQTDLSGPRLFGDCVYLEGFRFGAPSRERGGFDPTPARRVGIEVSDLMARIAATRGGVTAPVEPDAVEEAAIPF